MRLEIIVLINLILLSVSEVCQNKTFIKYYDFKGNDKRYNKVLTGVQVSSNGEYILLTFFQGLNKTVKFMTREVIPHTLNQKFLQNSQYYQLPSSKKLNFSTQFPQSTFSSDSKFAFLGGQNVTVIQISNHIDVKKLEVISIPGNYCLSRKSFEEKLLIWTIDQNLKNYRFQYAFNGSLFVLEYVAADISIDTATKHKLSPNGKIIVSYPVKVNIFQINFYVYMSDKIHPGSYFSPITIIKNLSSSNNMELDVSNNILVMTSLNSTFIFKLNLQTNKFQLLQTIYDNDYINDKVNHIKIVQNENRIIIGTILGIIKIYQINSQTKKYQYLNTLNIRQLNSLRIPLNVFWDTSFESNYLITGFDDKLMTYIDCKLCVYLRKTIYNYQQCSDCLQHSQHQTLLKSQYQFKCSASQYLCLPHEKYSGSNICLPCDQSCERCLDFPTKCITCKSNYSLDLVNFKCKSCPDSVTMYNRSVCLKCQSPCLTCSGQPFRCASCISDYELAVNQCFKTSSFFSMIILSILIFLLLFICFLLRCQDRWTRKYIGLPFKFQYRRKGNLFYQNIVIPRQSSICLLCLKPDSDYRNGCWHSYHIECLDTLIDDFKKDRYDHSQKKCPLCN